VGDGCGEEYYDGWEGDVDADAELAAFLEEETLFWVVPWPRR
jgi:hypothetical protein